MKAIVFTFVLTSAVLIVQGQFIPTKKCPAGEHSVLYCPQRAEPSCDNPTVHDLEGPAACGIPDCFCNVPNVRDLKSNRCIPLSKCPKN